MPRAHSVLLRKTVLPAARTPLRRWTIAVARGRLDELRKHPYVESQSVGVVGTLCRGDRVGVFALADVKCCRCPLCGFHRESFATRGRVRDDRRAQLKSLVAVAAPRRDQHREVRDRHATGRCGDAVCFVDELLGNIEPAREQLMGRRVVERERQNGQRPALTSDRAQSAGDVLAGSVVPHVHRELAGKPAPGDVLLAKALTLKGIQRLRHQWERRGVAAPHTAWSALRASGRRCAMSVPASGRSPPLPRRSRPGLLRSARCAPPPTALPGGLPRQRRIERFQALGCSAQQHRRVTAARARERDVGLQPIDSRAIQLVERAGGRNRQKPFGRG